MSRSSNETRSRSNRRSSSSSHRRIRLGRTVSTRNPPSPWACRSRSSNWRASARSGVTSTLRVEVAVVRRPGIDEPEVTWIVASRRR